MTAPWYRAAACHGADDTVFHPNSRDKSAGAAAIAICQTCPVRRACLDAALNEEGGAGESSRHGIRGALDPAGRVREYKRRKQVAKRAAAVRAKTGEQPATPTPQRPNPYAPKLTDAQRATIRARYADGGTLAGLAREYDVTVPSIRRTVRGIIRTAPAAECGTRDGYRAHRARGKEACRPCKDANADADRRLRNTGTSKPLAAG